MMNHYCNGNVSFVMLIFFYDRFYWHWLRRWVECQKCKFILLSYRPLPEEKLPQVKNKQSTQVTCKKLEADSKVQYVKSHGEISVKGQGDTWKGQGHSKWQGGKRILPLNEQTSKSAKKKKSKQMNQQLSNLLAKEKSEKKSANLSDFLSNLWIK